MLARPATGLDAVRLFNRYELKYVADRRLVTASRDSLGARVDRGDRADSAAAAVTH